MERRLCLSIPNVYDNDIIEHETASVSVVEKEVNEYCSTCIV